MADWLESIENPEIRGNENLAKFKSVESLAEGYMNLERRVGNSIRIPGENASDEDWAEYSEKLRKTDERLMVKPDPENAEQQKAFRAMMGYLDGPDAYEFAEDVQLPEPAQKSFKALLADVDLTKAQADKLAANLASAYEAQGNDAAAREHEQNKRLKTLFGEAEETRRAEAVALAEKYQAEGLPIGELTPAMVALLGNLAKAVRTNPQVFDQPRTPTSKLDPAEAKEQLRELRTAMRDGKFLPSEYPAKMEEIDRLVLIAYPQQ